MTIYMYRYTYLVLISLKNKNETTNEWKNSKNIYLYGSDMYTLCILVLVDSSPYKYCIPQIKNRQRQKSVHCDTAVLLHIWLRCVNNTKRLTSGWMTFWRHTSLLEARCWPKFPKIKAPTQFYKLIICQAPD